VNSIYVLIVVLTHGEPVDAIKLLDTNTTAVFKTEAECQAHVPATLAYWQGIEAATPNARLHPWNAACVKIESATPEGPKVGT